MKSAKSKSLLNRQSILLSLFIIVSLLSAINPYFKLDLQITEGLQNIQSVLFSQLMWFVTSLGNYPYMLFIVGITSSLLYLYKFRTEAIISSLAAAGSALSGSIIKMIVDRPRPEGDLVHVSVWLSDKSYPSNHVLVFTVFFGFLLYLLLSKPKHKTKGIFFSILFFLLIATIGISRIYLGAHWASDVLGGYLLGILWLIFTIRIYNSHNGKR